MPKKLVPVRLDDTEHRIITAAACAVGMSMQKYLLHTVMTSLGYTYQPGGYAPVKAAARAAKGTS